MAKSINLDEFEDVGEVPTRGINLSEFEDVASPSPGIDLSEFEDVGSPSYAVPPVEAPMFAMPSLGDVGEEYKAAGLAAARLGSNVVAGVSNFGNTVNANLLELMPFDFAQNLAGKLRQTTGQVEDLRQRVNRDYLTPNVVADPLSETGGQLAAAAVPTTVALMAGAPAIAVGGIGAVTGLGQGYSTAKDYGASDERAAVSGIANALINTSDAALGGKVSSAINPLLQAGLAVGRGAGINAGQEVLSNLEAKYLSGYDPERSLTENVLPSAIIGGGTTLAGNAPRINAGAAPTPRPQVEPPPLAEPPVAPPPAPEPPTTPPSAITPPPVRPPAPVESEVVQPPRTPPEPTTPPQQVDTAPPQRTETATPGTAPGSTPPPAGGDFDTAFASPTSPGTAYVSKLGDPNSTITVTAQDERALIRKLQKEYGLVASAKKTGLFVTGESYRNEVSNSPAGGVLAEIDAAMKLDPIKAKVELRRIAKRMGEPASAGTLSDLEARLRAKAGQATPEVAAPPPPKPQAAPQVEAAPVKAAGDGAKQQPTADDFEIGQDVWLKDENFATGEYGVPVRITSVRKAFGKTLIKTFNSATYRSADMFSKEPPVRPQKTTKPATVTATPPLRKPPAQNVSRGEAPLETRTVRSLLDEQSSLLSRLNQKQQAEVVSEVRANHRAAVKQALAEGRPVPPEVLADYPDLAPPPSREVGSDAPRQAATPPGERPTPPTGEQAMLSGPVNPEVVTKGAVGVLKGIGAVAKAGLRAVKGYSEPIIDRLSRLGGTVSKDFAKKLKTADDTAEKYRADLAPAVESGIEATRQLNKATTWMNGLVDRGKYAMSRVQLAAEGKIPVPDFAKSAMDAFNKSNRAIGDWAATKFDDFTASGKFQRNWTRDAVEAIRMGRGRMYDLMVESIADANRMPVEKVKAVFADLKSNFDSPSGDASWRKANQEFQRAFPEMPTHVKLNGGWREVIHASPSQYLEQSWRRTTRRGAVKDVIGDDLAETQKAILRELPDPTAFDEAMRAVSGVPTVQGVRVEPGGIADTAYRAARAVMKPVRQLQLGASSIVNIPETIFGGAGSQLGYRRALRAAIRIAGGKEGAVLDRMGAIDRNFYDNSISLDRPLASAERAVNNTLSKANLSRFFNELQEMRDAAIMRVAVDDMKAGKVKGRQAVKMARVLETMEEGTFSRADLDRIVAGKGTDAEYARIMRQAAPFFSGGKKTAAQSSRFLNNRLLTELFPFHSYGSMMANRALKHVHQVARDVRALKAGKGSWGDLRASSENMARFVGATTAQGIMGTFIRAAVYGGGYIGLSAAYNEAKDKMGNPLTGIMYLGGMLAKGISGPVELLTRPITESGGDVGGTFQKAANMKVSDMVYVGNIIKETVDAFQARGKFKDMDASERAYAYLKSRAPAVRIGDTVMGVFGLGEASPKMDGAISAFYQWKRENDPSSITDGGKIKDENVEFRQHMRRAYIAMKGGQDPEVIKDHLRAAGGAKSYDEIPESLRRKRILYKYGITDATKPEEMQRRKEMLQSLYKRIGPEAYEKLVEHDTIITIMTEQNLGGKSKMVLPWTPPKTKD